MIGGHLCGYSARSCDDSDGNVDAYCLMGNHYHLIVETELASLSAGLHRLNGLYAQGFNERHDRVGHLFQGRFGAR